MDWVDKSMRPLIISFVYLTRDISAFFYMHFIVYTLVFTVWQILLPCIIRKFKV